MKIFLLDVPVQILRSRPKELGGELLLHHSGSGERGKRGGA